MKITIEDAENFDKIYDVTEITFIGNNWIAKHTGMKDEWDLARSTDEKDDYYKGDCKYKWELKILLKEKENER